MAALGGAPGAAPGARLGETLSSVHGETLGAPVTLDVTLDEALEGTSKALLGEAQGGGADQRETLRSPVGAALVVTLDATLDEALGNTPKAMLREAQGGCADQGETLRSPVGATLVIQLLLLFFAFGLSQLNSQFQKEINRLTVASFLKLAEEDNSRSTQRKTIRQQIIDRLDYGQRSIPKSLIEAHCIGHANGNLPPSKDHITSSPDYIYFRVYTPRDTILARTHRRPSFDCAKPHEPSTTAVPTIAVLRLFIYTTTETNLVDSPRHRHIVSLRLHNNNAHHPGRFQTLQPGSAATTPRLPTADTVAPDQTSPDQDEEDNTSISDLFPSFDQPLATFLHESFDVPRESHSTLCEALITGQYKTWLDFLYIENIGDLAYLERGTRTPLYRHVQMTLQRVIDFGQHLTAQGLDWEDRNHYTKDAFKKRSSKPIEQLRYESWTKKSRDETTFPTLQNDATFERWLVKFKAKLETSDIDTHTFLDPSWPDAPLVGYEKALHDKQCAFFWTLVLHALQSDLSYSCVLSHTTSRDGRQAFFDFVALHDRSKSKVYDTSIVMQHLLDIDLRTWKDTRVKFITQWFAQLEHLNTLRDPQRPLDFDTVKTHLCKACSSSFQLSEQFCKVDDPPAAQDLIKFRQHEAIAISELKNILLLEATRLDSQASLSQPHSGTSVKANTHNLSSMTQSTYSALTDDSTSYLPPIDFDGDYQDYAVYKAGRTPDPTTRLPSAVWKTLSKQGMKHWLGFTADDKKRLVACLQSELLDAALPPDPNSSKPITRRAYEHITDEQVHSPDDEQVLSVRELFRGVRIYFSRTNFVRDFNTAIFLDTLKFATIV
eukprot:jgi/Psemu1/54282/gm1.54282_g